MSERFTVQVDIEARDNTSRALNGIKGGFKEAFSEVLTGALRRAGEGLASFAQQLPARIVDLAKLGVELETTQRRFEQFAGGPEQAAQYLEAFQQGTDNTIDRMGAMGSAAKLLQMGLVSTSGEMSTVAAIATKLGDQTVDAGTRIADFAALLANQSIPRLDNFGISSGRVRQRIDELLKSGQALNREEAFKMAVMEEGAKSLETLGDTSDLASVKIAKMTAALAEMKQGFAEILLEDISSLSGDIDSTAESVRTLPDRLRELRKELSETTFAYRLSNEEVRDAQEQYARQQERAELLAQTQVQLVLAMDVDPWLQYDWAMQKVNESYNDLTTSQIGAEDGLINLSDIAHDSGQAFDQYSQALLDTEQAQSDAAWEAVQLQRELAATAEQAVKTGRAALDMAMAYTDQLAGAEDATERFNRQIEDENARHQQKLTELRQRGQSRAVRINEEEVRDTIQKLQERLYLAELEQADFTDKTKEATRQRKEWQIRDLREQIAEEQKVLDDYHAGRLISAGENVGGLIAEEQRRHDESIALLNDQMTQQEEAQKQALGRMVLNHFEAWVEMNVAADGYTQEEAQFVARMREEISREYGLVTDAAIGAMQTQESRWAGMVAQMTGQADSFFDHFMQRFNALPSERVIRIRTELATPQTAGPGGGEVMQHGSAFAGGGWALVGERGPELAMLPRGATVFPADQTRHITNNFNLAVNSQQSAMSVANEFELMRGLVG